MSFQRLHMICVLAFLSACSTGHHKGTSPVVQGGVDEVIYFHPEAVDSSRLPTADNEPLEKAKVNTSTLNYQQPAAQSGQAVQTKACGYLYGTEDNRNAISQSETLYVMDIDCSSVAGANSASAHVISLLSAKSMLPQQRGYIARWRKSAVQQSVAARRKNADRAVPYLCFQGQVSQALCKGESYNQILKTDRMTSRSQVYNSWN
ncbi:MAG: hypothetical protein K2P92_08275 [Bdellovibrionaceae bacterium]|nr:hypothetical protein [Pseudobdellovibrionaceae bacterium]